MLIFPSGAKNVLADLPIALAVGLQNTLVQCYLVNLPWYEFRPLRSLVYCALFLPLRPVTPASI